MNIRRWVAGFFAVSMLVAGVLGSTAYASPNDFSISSFEADYYLTRDGDGHSRLKTVEEITAVFPFSDQNHGIERAIPESYDGHTVQLAIDRVTDGSNKAIAYTTYGSGDNLVVRIGESNKYVHGVQTYRISYTAHDVTKTFNDHDEFYWDINGTQWAQPFGSVIARLHVPSDLNSSLKDRLACYTGVTGSKAQNCTISQVSEANGTLVTSQVTSGLKATENLSIVVGLKSQTFAAYQKPTWERILPLGFIIWSAIGVGVLVIMSIVLTRVWRQYGQTPAGKGSIVPEYLPPSGLSVIQSATILKKSSPATTAQIIDLAVRHYIKIYDTESKRFFSKKHAYELELIHTTDHLREEEKATIAAVFGFGPVVGRRVGLKKLSSKLAKLTEKILKDADKNLVTAGYYADHAGQRKKYYWVGGLLTGIGLMSLNIGMFIAGIASLIVASRLKPLTGKGVASRDYLKGLEMYMKMAEADRIALLQSPDGAEKVDIDPSNNAQLVKLYEKLLPYAILFGIDKEWAKQFAALYQEAPDWYVGNWTTFNAAVFATSFHNFSAASTTTFAPPSSSDSSGFSSGGGFSGGGGGGGGGGGW